jgi:transposase
MECFLNSNLLRMHYGVGVVPARPYRPRDKAKVEVGVEVVERWIIAALRHHKFFRLEEVNRAIRELLERLNQRPFRSAKDREPVCLRPWNEVRCARCRPSDST